MNLSVLKQQLDDIAHARHGGRHSWLDTHFEDEQYHMPGDERTPALRYSFMTFGDQDHTKYEAATFRNQIHKYDQSVYVSTHLTRSHEGIFYWKVEAFLPLHNYV